MGIRKGKVTVCMATFNGGRFIKEQLDSIICQLNAQDQIIISDDGSSDDTLAIISSYNDSRIKVYHHKSSITNPWGWLGGDKKCYAVSINFNNALLHGMDGDFIFLTDQDDIWAKDKVEKMVNVMQAHPDSCVMCNSVLTDINGNVVSGPLRPKTANLSMLQCIIHPIFSGCTLAFDSAFMKRVVPMPRLIPSHDAFIGLTATATRRLYVIDKPLHYYRGREGTNVSASISNSIIFKIIFRLYLLIHIYYRIIINKINHRKR